MSENRFDSSRLSGKPPRTGTVYALINPYMDMLLKCGGTENTGGNRAFKISSHEGVPDDYRIFTSFNSYDVWEDEAKIHMLLSQYRIKKNKKRIRPKEFFGITESDRSEDKKEENRSKFDNMLQAVTQFYNGFKILYPELNNETYNNREHKEGDSTDSEDETVSSLTNNIQVELDSDNTEGSCENTITQNNEIKIISDKELPMYKKTFPIFQYCLKGIKHFGSVNDFAEGLLDNKLPESLETSDYRKVIYDNAVIDKKPKTRGEKTKQIRDQIKYYTDVKRRNSKNGPIYDFFINYEFHFNSVKI
jgi:T5orf172 domain